MYFKMKLVDTVRVPPHLLGGDMKEVAWYLLQEKLEGRIDKKLGMIVSIIDIVEIGDGRILSGDGAVYYDATFNALAFRPIMQEIVEGDIVEILEFGAFIEVGAMDALLHISQITDDFISYDEKNARLACKEKARSLSEGDSVRARIVAISLNEREPKNSKVGLTMRQPALGKLEWIAEQMKKKEEQVRMKEEQGSVTDGKSVQGVS